LVIQVIGKAIELITHSKYAIAFTGAGISAESGIPTFKALTASGGDLGLKT